MVLIVMLVDLDFVRRERVRYRIAICDAIDELERVKNVTVDFVLVFWGLTHLGFVFGSELGPVFWDGSYRERW